MKKPFSTMARMALLLALVGVTFLSDTAEAQAADFDEFDEEIASLESGPIVRRQLLHRSGRFELQPMMAFSLNDAFVRNAMPGISATYFLNNVFGMGATFNFGLLQFDTSLRRNLEAQMSADRLDRISYAKFNWTMDAGLIYVPAFGKFSVMNSFQTHYDLHLIGGMAMVSEGVEAAGLGAGDPGLVGVRPGGMFGAGLRFFLGDMLSLNFQMRNYVTSRAQISSGSATPQLGNTVILSTGVSIFFPGEVKISR